MDQCWDCQREQAICRSKRRYDTPGDAANAATEQNETNAYERMLVGYSCPWCLKFHLTKAKPGTARWKRAEKRRRRWLVANLTNQTSTPTVPPTQAPELVGQDGAHG